MTYHFIPGISRRLPAVIPGPGRRTSGRRLRFTGNGVRAVSSRSSGRLQRQSVQNALVVLLTFQSAQWINLKPELLANLAAGIFILPFFLFSATAGQMADKYDKAMLARLVKLLEMAIMGVAAAGFYLQSLTVLMIGLFLLGLHSTLFGAGQVRDPAAKASA